MGAQGSTAVPWGCPWAHARSRGYARQARVPARCWQGHGMLTWREQIPVFAGVQFILPSVPTAAPCPARPRLLLPLPALRVMPGCHPAAGQRFLL